ncbi:MAG: ribbon-helix-helix domain-containing protein [Acidobacteriia bacterium]|nr:ribbon-helix-helix domain-containing protein [Terriglobia bacterium]
MGQVTIYLDDDTEKSVKKAAKSEGVSLSKWITAALRAKTATVWPKEVLDLEGAWPDFPEIHELRRAMLHDARREEL